MVTNSVSRSMSHVVLAAAVCAASLLAAGGAWAEASGGWLAAEVAGQVTERAADGTWQPIERGSALPDGARVKTGPDGKLVLSHNKDTVTLSPNSELELPRKTDGASAPGLLQTLGTLLFRVEHSPGRRFEVDAPYLAAVVKGTVFTVSVSTTGNSVHVAEGAVEVTASASHEVALVHPGQTVVVSSAGRGLSIMDGTHPQRRSEIEAPDGKAKGRTANAGDSTPGAQGIEGSRRGAQITRTLGGGHLDVSGLSGGLVQDGDDPGPRGRVANANPNAGGGNANAGGGNANAGGGNANAGGANAGGDNADAGGGNGNVGGDNANAGGGNPGAGGGNANPGGGNANAGGSNPNAGGGNPSAGGGNPNAAGGNPNVAAGNLNAAGGNPNAAGGNPNGSGGNPNAAGSNPNAMANAGGANANAAGNPNAAANKGKSQGKH